MTFYCILVFPAPYLHFSLFDNNDLAVPMETTAKVGVIFEKILMETVKPRDEQEHDMCLEQRMRDCWSHLVFDLRV